jgi:hypothetical protein
VTHHTHEAATRAALVDLADRLYLGGSYEPVSGRHEYREEAITGWVVVRLRCADTEVGECDTADDEPSWRVIDDYDRAEPGWPLDEERAAWALWLDGADVD